MIILCLEYLSSGEKRAAKQKKNYCFEAFDAKLLRMVCRSMCLMTKYEKVIILIIKRAYIPGCADNVGFPFGSNF